MRVMIDTGELSYSQNGGVFMGRSANGQGTYVKLDNGKWQCKMMCTYKTELGRKKMVSGTGKTKDEAHKNALAKRKEWDKVRSLGHTVNSKDKERIFKDLMAEWLEIHAMERQWSGNTKGTRTKNVENMLVSQIGDLKIKSIDTNILNTAIMKMLEKYSRSNVGMVYSLTGQFFDYLKLQGIITDNPFDNVMKLPKRKKVKEFESIEEFKEDDDGYHIFTEAEIGKLLNSCTTYTGYPKMVLENPRASIFAVMFLTGMRGQEIRALRLSDVDFESHTITINKALSVNENNKIVVKEPKTKNSKRIIGINAETERYLHILIDNRPNKKTDLLCCTKNGTWIDRRNFLRMFNTLLKQCGIEANGRSPHSLRHTFISFAIEKNAMSPLKDKEMLFVSRYVGHADLTTTLNIYTHLQQNKLKEVDYGVDEPLEIEYT